MGKFSLSLAEIEKQISLVDGSKAQAALDYRRENPQLTTINPTPIQSNINRGVTTTAPVSVNGQKAKATTSNVGAQITYPDGTGYWYEPNSKADPMERLSFSDWIKGTNTLQSLQEQSEAAKAKSIYNQNINSVDSELSADLQKWSNPEYKMTDADKAKFKEYQNRISLGGSHGYNYADLQGEQLDNFIAVGNKVNKLANFAYGLTDNPLGKLVANTYSKLGVDADENALDELKEGRSNAYTQDMLSTGAGALTGQIANYNIGSKVAQSIPALQKASGLVGKGVENLTKSSKIGNAAQNIFGDMMLDVALDTVPTTIENVQSGMDTGEVAKETAKNIGLNLAFNLGGEVLGNVLPTLKKANANVENKNSVEIATEKMLADAKNDGFAPTTYAKSNGIISYDKKRIEQLSSSKGKVDGKDSFADFIKESKNNNSTKEIRYYFGTISDELADDIFANTGLDLEGFNIAVRGDEIRHAYNNHGNAKAEALRGQIAVTDDMLEKLPSVFNKPDSIKVSPKKDYAGRTAIQIEKRIDGHVVTVNGVSKGKHNLELDTIRIYPTETKKISTTHTVNDNSPIPKTPETSMGEGYSSDLSISKTQNNVNSLSKQIQDSYSGLKVNDAVSADVDSKLKELYSYADGINGAKSKQELMDMMQAFENKTIEIDGLLKGNASYSSKADNGSKQLFEDFKNATKNTKIKITDDILAELNLKTVKDASNSIHTGLNTGSFAKNSGTPLDEIFDEIDNGLGTKLSSFMKNNGMNPENPVDQYKGLVEYAKSVKHKDAFSEVLAPYESGSLFTDDVYSQFMKNVEDKYKQLSVSTKTMAEDIGIPKTESIEGPEMGISKYSSYTAIHKTDLPDSVKNEFADNPQMYEVVKNANTAKEADEFISTHTIDESYAEFTKRLERKDPTSITMGYRLAKMYGESGNTAMAVEIVESMSSQLTKAGQFTQAAAIDLLKENPMAAMRYMDKQINKLNQTGAEKFGKKWTDFKMTDDEVKAFSEIEPNDTEAIKELYENISKRIAKDYPATMWEKVVEASKTAMMLNPRTHLRNVVANAIMTPVRSLSDRISALGQNAVKLFNPDMTVTQSLIGGTKQQKEIATEIFNKEFLGVLKGTEKWEEAYGNIFKNKQVFKDSKAGKSAKKASLQTLNAVNELTNGRLDKLVEMADDSMTGSIMENLRKFNYWLLGDIEDDIFVRKNFTNRLASYMRAQGINSIDDVPAEAKGIAFQEALKATFKDDNNITRAFSGIKKNTGKFGEVLLPFTKTPANIAARGIDYSPAGFINAIKQAKDGGTITNIIDTASKASLGTGAIFLGYLLAKEGMIQGALSSDKDQQQFEKQQGKQAFSINVNGKYYTYDWAQPAAIPIILGSAIYDGIKESDGEVENLLNIGWQATKAGVDAWAGLSPISSLQDILGGGTYSSDSIAENLLNEVVEFPQRLYPSALTATAKTIDPTYRQTYTKGDVLQTQIDTLKSKIPVLSKSLPVSYDTWGNERKRQDSTKSAAFANFVNPGTLGYDASTPIDGEINRLFETTQNKSVFPNKAEWTVKDRYGNSIDLTSQQYSDYQKAMGQTSYRLADAFLSSDIYQDMSDEDRASTLSDIYSAVKSMTKNKMFGASVSAENQKVIDAYNANGTQGVINFIRDKHILNSYGLKSNDKSSLEFINEHGVDVFKEVSDAIEKFGMKQNKENRELYLSGGLPMLKHASNADANNDGKVTKTKELIPYLKMQNWTAEEKNRVVEQFGFSTKNLKW